MAKKTAKQGTTLHEINSTVEYEFTKVNVTKKIITSYFEHFPCALQNNFFQFQNHTEKHVFLGPGIWNNCILSFFYILHTFLEKQTSVRYRLHHADAFLLVLDVHLCHILDAHSAHRAALGFFQTLIRLFVCND